MPRRPCHRGLPQLRHHGAHRCRQDHDHRAHPLLHRQEPQDRRSARRRRDDGLDGAGAGARHHHHVGRDDRVLERQAPEHHRHPRPRRLHHRSRAFAARARRRRLSCSTPTRAWSRRPRPSGARATSTTCRASSSPTRWTRPAPTSSSACDDIIDRLGAKPIAIQLPIGAENNFKGLVDLVRMKGVIWEDEALGAKYNDIEIPADLARPGQGISREADRSRRRTRRRRAGRLSRRQGAGRGDAEAADPQGGADRRLLSGALRLGLQEQGRAAAARRRRRLSAVAARRAGDQGHRPDNGERNHPQAGRQRAAVAARRSRSWTTRSSAPSPSAASIRARWPAAPASSTRPASARSASAACC